MNRTQSSKDQPQSNTVGVADAGQPPPSLRTAFGRRLRTLRHHRVMSQRALASGSGVSLNTIGSIERGLRFPSPEVLEALARALQVEVRDLFDVGEHSTPATLEGAARELCRALEVELLPEVRRLSTLAQRLLAEVDGKQPSDNRSGAGATARRMPASAA